MNVKELKEFIKDLPDETHVCSCCASPIDDPSSIRLVEDYEAYHRPTDSYVLVDVVIIH